MKVIIFCCVIFTCLPLLGQYTYDWSVSFGGNAWDQGRAITTDSLENIYTVGYFEGTADLDPGPAVQNFTSTSSQALFIQKFDPSGILLWAKAVTGGQIHGNSIDVDNDGNVVIVGHYGNTLDFDPGPSTYNLTSINSWDIFVLKLNNSGDFIWAKSIGGDWGEDRCFDLQLDGAGNVYFVGQFYGTADFDPGPSVYTLAGANGFWDSYIVKLDTNGDFLWAKNFGSSPYDSQATAICLDQANGVFIAGVYENTADFDPGAAVYSSTSNGAHDIYLVKLDTSGNFLWARTTGSTPDEKCFDMDIDANGSVCLTGQFIGTVDFDPGTGTQNLTAVDGAFDGDVFIQKIDNNGNFVWAKSFGSTSYDQGNAVSFTNEGNVVTTGQYYYVADFDPGPGVVSISGEGEMDIFISVLDSNGNYLWAENIGGADYEYSYGLTVSKQNAMIITGMYEQTVDFDPGPGTDTQTATSVGFGDAFIVKLNASSIGLDESQKGINMSVYPNPSSGKFLIQCDGTNNLMFSVYDCYGKTICYSKQVSTPYVIDLSMMDNGTYYCRLEINGEIKHLRLVRQ